MEPAEKKSIDASIKKHKASAKSLIAVFQDIQKQQGYLSEEAVRYVAGKLTVPASRAFAVATFYSAFSLIPRGRNTIHVCLGTACHIKGAGRIAERISRHLQIKPEERTTDGRFSLHTVRCLGCCALAPVVKVNNDIHADTTQDRISAILEKYQ